KLDIGGSFFGSTAESILFEDGFKYSAIASQQEPLLTISVPVGLQIGVNPGEIKVNGTGHNLISQNATFRPSINPGNTNYLEVNSGKTLALIGGDIHLNGGIIDAEAEKIELGSIGEGIVNLNQTNQEFTFDYTEVSSFRDIHLSQHSLVNASGKKAGSIHIQAANFTINDGSLLRIENQGLQSSGNISVNASELFTIKGTSSDGSIASGLRTSTLSEGKAGDISISGKRLVIENRGTIASNTYGLGKGGDLNLNLTESIKLFGISPISNRSSIINSITYAAGDSGAVNLSTKELTILDGAIIGSTTLGTGNAADVIVNVSESIEAVGISPIFQPSAINSSTIGSGNAGNLTVNTKSLSIRDGARLDSSTSIIGAAGSVTVNASQSVEVSGIAEGSRNPSLINSSANILDEVLRKRLGLPDKPFGASGNVEINTPSLTVKDGGLVSVRNDGFGNGGSLQINANSLNLDTKGSITAATESGEGGDISLNLHSALVIRRGSLINTESLGTGNGGNITINSPVIAGFENSDIIANAVEGNGGNIDITTQGIFGLEFRDELSESSDITASSRFGVSGKVEINNIGIDPSSGLVELDLELADSSQQIAQGCSSNSDNSFVATGRGGIPRNPNEQIDTNLNWSDIRDLSAFRQETKKTAENTKLSNKPAIVEATGFIRNSKGEIELVALGNNSLINKKFADRSGINT
ncbi:MAG: S-layer family protein, partial [Cyanobacteria bacterium J06629_18]